MIVYLALDRRCGTGRCCPSSGGVGPPGAKVELAPGQRSIEGYLTFLWQYAFPQLGFMFNWFKGWAPYDLWLSSWIGRFGWGDSGFEPWVVACVGRARADRCSASAAARSGRAEPRCARGCPRSSPTRGSPAGLLLLLSWVGYGYRTTNGATFEQGRYLFPLMALWGALIAIGLAGFGRRIGPVVAVTVVLLAVALDVGGVMIMIQRYYSG